MTNNLLLRTLTSPYGDFTKGSVLSREELDDNFIFLKGDVIYTAQTTGNVVTLKKNNGNDLSFNVGSGGTPSAPNSSVQYNNAGAFFGDALFTRDPVNNNTTISQNFGGNELGTFQLDGSNVDLLYTNTITGEGAGMNFNNSSGVEAQLAYNDGANQFNNLVFNTNSTSLTWDFDTTDTITAQIVQNENILGYGGKGTAILYGDATTPTNGIALIHIGVVSGTGLTGISATVLDQGGHSIGFDMNMNNGFSGGYVGTNLQGNIALQVSGNTITWDADTTDTIVDRIEQNENILGEGVKGNLIIHEDTFTSNSARILVGDTSAVGGTPFQVNIGVDDATLNKNSVLILDANLILAVVEDVTNNITSGLALSVSGNSMNWNADTTDNIIAKIEQGQNILNAGVKGTSILYGDTVTEEKALIIVGDGTGAGGEPFQISLRTDDGTGNVSTFIGVDSVNGISMGAEDLGVSFIASYADFTLTGNTIQWDADTTDTIITKLEQSQNLIENGISGSALIWEDFSTQIRSAVAVYDATAIGGEQGNAAITTINTATGDQAAVTTYNDPIEGMSVGASAQNGNIQTNLSLSSIDGIFNYRTEGGVGQEAMVSVTPTETFMSFILDSLSPTYKASLGNGVFSIDDSVNSILYLDIANGQSVFGNVAAASGITVFVDNANGINIQAPESVINVGANGFGNETNLQVDDNTGIIKASIPAGGDFEINRLSDNKVAFTVLPDNFYVKLGDCDNIASGTTITVDDSTQLITSSSGGGNKNILVGKTKLLPDNTVTSVFEVALTAGGMAGGFFTATVIATDGTELQAHSDHVTYAAVNKAGVYTTQITNSNAGDAIANSSGTLTITWSIVTGTNKITISVNADSSLPASTITLAGLNIDNNNGHIVTIL